MTTRQPQTRTGSEYWVSCPECGETKRNKWESTCSINLETGAYKCFRCGWGGYLNTGQLLQVLGAVGEIDFETLEPEVPEILPEFHAGAYSDRRSLVPRQYAFFGGKAWDAFEYKNPRGNFTGYLLKRKGEAHNIGGRSYLYPSPLGGTGTVLRVVEGPYDVLEPGDVGVGGIIRPWQVYRDFPLYGFVFCPDGDVWEKDDLRTPFLLGLERVLRAGALVGVEFIPGGRDPDEVPPHLRTVLSPRQCLELIRAVKRERGV